MNDITKTLHNILEYYYTTRQVGHTKLIEDCYDHIREANAYVVLASHMNRDALYIPTDIKTLTLDDFCQRQAVGCKNPIIFDNYAIITLLTESIKEIRSQKHRAEKAEKKLKMIKEITELD